MEDTEIQQPTRTVADTRVTWKHRNRGVEFVRAIWGTTPGKIGSSLIIFVALVAVFAPLIAPHDPIAIDVANRLQPPSAAHLFGTDETGRDVFSRVLYGARIDLRVGIIAVAIALGLGVTVGIISGFYGGIVDTIMMRVVDIMLAFPGFLLALAIIAMLGPSLRNALL
ncbi:MAG TPA: ABC transporter permease, partial [Thermomicrobiaceae bacterium]|nr:ABC transporter permease [Thermomicrobiaceae bacterium]